MTLIYILYILLCMIMIPLLSKEDPPECNSISSISIGSNEISNVVESNTSVAASMESLQETIRNACNHLDDNASLDLCLKDSSFQTDWKLIWWKDLSNFDEVLLLLFTHYIIFLKRKNFEILYIFLI